MKRCELCRELGLIQSSIRFLWNYDREARDLIVAMKYRPSRTLSALAAETLADHFAALAPIASTVTALPASVSSLKERGFNQCTILAKVFARRAELEFDPYLLRHRGCRAPQASLPPKRRLSNVRKSFLASDRVNGKRLILLEDVITTGATVAAATRALMDAGALSVHIIALARSPRWEQYRHEVLRRFGTVSS